MDYITTTLLAEISPLYLAIAILCTVFAGFVKGTVGFAMPMVMISAFSSFLPPDTALAGLILPTLVTNFSQAFREGFRAALDVSRRYWRFLVATLVFIVVSAPFVRDIPQMAFLLLLGVPITLYALLQLMGKSLSIGVEHRTRAEWMLGILAGLYGGISGVWGPPLIVYLMSVGAPKREMLLIQGVVFMMGAVVLFGAHVNSGVLNAPNTIFSAILVLPAMLGLTMGYRLGDRLDQTRFRRWTQILLVVAGVNLIRRALTLGSD
jgi:uncharacterized protein